jgi:hypothetical protein
MPEQNWPIWEDRGVADRAGGRCEYCGFDGTQWSGWWQLEIDHLIPKYWGGTEEFNNKVLACHGCNHEKLSYDPRERQPIEPNTEAARLLLIANARRYIESRKERMRHEYQLSNYGGGGTGGTGQVAHSSPVLA